MSFSIRLNHWRRLGAVCLLLSASSTAVAADEVWDSVFAFQKKMADSGSVEAHAKLAEMYQEGRGTPQDLDKAIEWYKDAASHGYAGAQAKIEELQQMKNRAVAEASAAQ
jgi:TPR repeat protein